ncbi:hypothetical protein, partial [Necropsobacter massiliensis]|uniref:hypothetical protein n=1 Tax=Necropsobacter massiliensis TaxID=1400001 RepID=UPI0005958CA4
DIENHADYNGKGVGVSGSVAMNVDTPLGNKENGIAQSNKQATNDNGEKIYIDQNGKETIEVKTGDNANRVKLATGWGSLQTSVGIGLGSTKESNQSITRSGINTANIEIRNPPAQLEQTGKTVEETLVQVKTDVSTATAEANLGKLENHFDKEKVLKELNVQVKATQEFRQNAFSTID